MNRKDNIRLLYVDLFCGAGGTSTGVEQATLHGEKCAHVAACLYHIFRNLFVDTVPEAGTQTKLF